MEFFRKIFTIKRILVVSLLVIVLLAGYVYLGNNIKNKSRFDIDNLQKRITSLGELNTIEYYYQNLLRFEDSKELKGIKLPFTTKAFLIMYEGYIKAGVDLRDAKIEVEDEKKAIISLRGADFTNNVIKEDSVKIYDERSGLFNPLKIKEVFQLLDKEKNKLQQQLAEEGFLEEANQKNQRLITSLLAEIGFKEIIFQFN